MSKFKFLIVGTGRSGTSLLAILLDTHPSIQVGFERFAIDYLRVKKIKENPDSVFTDRAYGFLSCCEQEAASCDKAIWANKVTTESVDGLNRHNLYHSPAIPVLNEFFDVVLKGKKIIFILRDGRSCIKSRLRHSPQPEERAIANWKQSVDYYRFFKNRENTLCIKFEELVTDTHACLAEVFQFLEIENSVDVGKATSSKKMLPSYRRDKIDQNRAVDLDTKYLSEIEAELKFCGYL